MAAAGSLKPTLELEDVRDWAYCPLRVWWRHKGLTSGIAGFGGNHTGESLVRESIRSATHLYYRRIRKQPEFSFGESIGLIWRHWLETWELTSALASHLVEYHLRRRAMLDRFDESFLRGQDDMNGRDSIRKRVLCEDAITSGLSNLRKQIDCHQEAIGMVSITDSDDDGHQSPIGLADAFSHSMDMAEQIHLPDPSSVIGVKVPMVVDLPTVSLKCRADIVQELERSRGVGRPSSDPCCNVYTQKLETTVFLFDEILPSLNSLAMDIRILAFRWAKLAPDGSTGKNVVKRVCLYHLPSGASQAFSPRIREGLDYLDALSKSVMVGIRYGLYVPRWIQGWHTCGDCEYRKHCFSGTGVFQAFDSTYHTKIEGNHSVQDQMVGVNSS
jgi:hypothetical protein